MPEMREGDGFDKNSSPACKQGGAPRSSKGYQTNLMTGPHSPTIPWHMTPIKQEPADERNDSGIASENSNNSSPGSENHEDYNNQNYPTSTVNTFQLPHQNLAPYYSVPFTPTMLPSYLLQAPHISSANTQAGNDPMPSTSSQFVNGDAGNHEETDPLRSLQMSLERTGLLSEPSPKSSQHSADGDDKVEDLENCEDENLTVPKMNSHGKVKTFKCKQCDFVAITKLDFWRHNKDHIKSEKQLTCPKCPFVTEYKHHLEYHLRNHVGSKPFKCDKCAYTCVNKSMLNSHMKSHSNVYQYHCSNCSYATKYCHSLKLHLRKYGHKPDKVLYPDGSVNPFPVIDVYGTRRGPKTKQVSQQNEVENNSPQALQNLTQLMLTAAPPQLTLPFNLPFTLDGLANILRNPMLFPANLSPMAQRLMNEELERYHETQPHAPAATSSSEVEVLDLRKQEEPIPKQPVRNRRKGMAFKLNLNNKESDDNNDEAEDFKEKEEEDITRLNPASEDGTRSPSSEDQVEIEESAEEEIINNNIPNNYSCQFCSIAFGDVVLYTMHMGYHGYKDPFTCNMCGAECKDKVAFFLHIARTSHS